MNRKRKEGEGKGGGGHENPREEGRVMKECEVEGGGLAGEDMEEDRREEG